MNTNTWVIAAKFLPMGPHEVMVTDMERPHPQMAIREGF
jgi:hypothetical protein